MTFVPLLWTLLDGTAPRTPSMYLTPLSGNFSFLQYSEMLISLFML
jgi:hypothetical protein